MRWWAGRSRSLMALGLMVILVAPLGGEAQQAGRMYRIGYLFEGPPGQISASAPLRVLEENLRDLGYVEGRNLVVERRFAAFKYDRLPDLAAELVRLKPDVILTGGNPSIAALKQATTTVPVVMAYAVDPVGAGLVTSLARPGGNITGSSATTGPEFIAKQLEILNEIVPKGAFAAMTRSRAGAFPILGGSLTYVSRQQIADLAVQHRPPGIHLYREYAEAGLLLTYGPETVAQFRRAATYIDKILKGARPADLPVQEPTKFELLINLKTAKALGLTIPQSLLIRADQIIE